MFLENLLKVKVENESIQQVIRDRGSDLFKAMTLRLAADYWPLWEGVIKEFEKRTKSPTNFRIEFENHAPYWAIILVALKYHFEGSNEPLLTEGRMTKEVLEALQLDTSREINRCRKVLISEKIIKADEEQGRLFYRLDGECVDILLEYLSQIAVSREKLESWVRAEFSLG
jgi:hypothetical protein